MRSLALTAVAVAAVLGLGRVALAQTDPDELFPRRGGDDDESVFPGREAGPGDACADEGLLAPIALGLRDSGLDTTREACTETALRGSLRASALIDSGDFYGTLVGSLFAEARFDHLAGVEVALGARVLDWRFAQTAVFPERELAVGPLYVGGHRAADSRWFGRAVTIGHSLRFEIPGTDTGYEPVTVAAAPAYHVSMATSERTRVHGRVAALLWAALPDAGVETRAALSTGFDGALALGDHVSVIAGTEVQGGWYDAGLDHVLLRGGARVGFGESRIALGVVAPLFGEERTNLAGAVTFTRRR